MNNFISGYGLLNTTSKDVNAENAPLTTIVYLKMLLNKNRLGTFEKEYLRIFSQNMETYIHSCETINKGLYNQRPFTAKSHEDYMSPDQLIAFTAFLHIFYYPEKLVEINQYLKKNLGNYNNVQDGKKRFMQIPALLFPAACLGSKIAKYILYVHCIFTAYRYKEVGEATSGLQKIWLILQTLGSKKVFKYCTKIQKRSWYEIWEVYYKENNHLIRKVIL